MIEINLIINGSKQRKHTDAIVILSYVQYLFILAHKIDGAG
jgi:hypothetical protein